MEDAATLKLMTTRDIKKSLKEAPDANTIEKIKEITKHINDKKGRDIVILELFKLTSFTDFFIICTGENSPHINAMADEVEMNLRKNNEKPLSITGHTLGQWILMDYNDIIVHIFDETTRFRYNLEALWLDAERVTFD
jgi:ribosome-associated protein